MEWFMQAVNLGRRISYKGLDYIVLHSLANNCFLAARANEEMPAVVYWIHDDSAEEIEKEKT
jgi:hypothetical protein